MLNMQRLLNVPGVDNIYQLDNFYVASQPSEETLEWIKNSSIQKVINLRDQDEMDFAFEKNFCEKSDIEYHQFPVTCNGSFITANIKKLNELVKNKDEKYFIHCGSANRVIAWLLTYLPTHRQLSFEETEKLALDMGLTNASFIEQAKDLLLA